MESKLLEGSAQGGGGDLKLVAHPRAKSKVWKYFGFDTNAEGCILQWKKIYCRVCGAQIAYSGNTSNLAYHLEKNHPEAFCEFIKSNTEQMREAFASAFSKLKPEAASSASQPPQPPQPPPAASTCAQDALPVPGAPGLEARRQQELTGAVLALLCQGLHPAALVDEPPFRALLRAAEPRYELPSARFFCAQALPERQAAVRQAVRRELAEAAWCGVSTELWRSDVQNRTYVTLAAHFLRLASPGGGSGSGGLEVASRCLQTFEVPEEDAAEAITRVLYEAFLEWGIGAKVCAATTDGGRDMAKACALLDVPVHMPCLGRTLHAGLQQAFQLPRLGALLGRCRRLVAHFQQSPAATCLLLEKQRQLQGARCVLVSDRVARWGRTLAMLQRLREQQFAIAGVLLEDSHHQHLMLEAAEWATLDALVELLEPFQQAADMLAAARSPPISMLKPLLHALLRCPLGVRDGDSTDLATAKELIAKELSRAYQEAPEVDMFLNVATFLDPRYKRLPFLSALERQQVEARVLEEAKGLLEKMKDGRGGAQPPPGEDGLYAQPPPGEDGLYAQPPPGEDGLDPDSADEPPAKKRAAGGAIQSLLAELFCPAGGAEEQDEWQAQVLEELSSFKSQKVLGLREDPLQWWSERLALFPVLPKVLQKYWCVAATRVAPARLFGPAASVLRAKRNRLAPAHLDRQIFLYENARAPPEPRDDDDEGQWGLERPRDASLGDAGDSGGFSGGLRDGDFL